MRSRDSINFSWEVLQSNLFHLFLLPLIFVSQKPHYSTSAPSARFLSLAVLLVHNYTIYLPVTQIRVFFYSIKTECSLRANLSFRCFGDSKMNKKQILTLGACSL